MLSPSMENTAFESSWSKLMLIIVLTRLALTPWTYLFKMLYLAYLMIRYCKAKKLNTTHITIMEEIPSLSFRWLLLEVHIFTFRASNLRTISKRQLRNLCRISLIPPIWMVILRFRTNRKVFVLNVTTLSLFKATQV